MTYARWIGLGALVGVACAAGCAQSHGAGAGSSGTGGASGGGPFDASVSPGTGGDGLDTTTGRAVSPGTTGASTSTTGASALTVVGRVPPACPETESFEPCETPLNEWHALALVIERDLPEPGAEVLAAGGEGVLLGNEGAGRYWVTLLRHLEVEGVTASELPFLRVDATEADPGLIPRAVWGGYNAPLQDLVEGADTAVLACDDAGTCDLLVGEEETAPALLPGLQVPTGATGLVGDGDRLCVLADALHCLADGEFRVELRAQQGGPFLDATFMDPPLALTEREAYTLRDGRWQRIEGFAPHASPNLSSLNGYSTFRTADGMLVLSGPEGSEVCGRLGSVVIGALTRGSHHPVAWALDSQGRLLQQRGAQDSETYWCVAGTDYPTQWDATRYYQCGAGGTLLGVKEGQLWGVLGEPRCVVL